MFLFFHLNQKILKLYKENISKYTDLYKEASTNRPHKKNNIINYWFTLRVLLTIIGERYFNGWPVETIISM